MRILGFFLFLAVLTAGLAAPSYAIDRSGGWGIFSKSLHGAEYQPYIGEQLIRQSSAWEGDTWTPQYWTSENRDEKHVMRDLYAGHIIIDQYTDRDNIPVLEVGDQFVQLSGIDRRRVLQFVDHVFEITTSEENGMFFVFHSANDDEPLGLYNKHGFQSY